MSTALARLKEKIAQTRVPEEPSKPSKAHRAHHFRLFVLAEGLHRQARSRHQRRRASVLDEHPLRRQGAFPAGLGAGHHAGVPVIGRCVGVHVDGPNGVSLASPHTQHSSDNPSFADHLFDHLIGADEQCRRKSEVERFCCPEIDRKLEFGRLYYG